MPGDISRSTFSAPRHYQAVRKQQGRVDLDADWNEQVDIISRRFAAEALDLVGRSGVPKDNAGFGVSVVNNVPVLSAGRAYVDGILCENEHDALALNAQPDLPNVPPPNVAGRYLVYLDVWEREITALDDPNIREIALGGADTCTRSKTVWQVKLLNADVSDGQAAFDALSAASPGTLAAQSAPTQTSSDPCIIAPWAGYTGLENQLYRVEILAGGAAAAATFTWARDNASTIAAWTAQNGNALTMTASNGATFTGGQWVELTDDTHVLLGVRGVLVRLLTVGGSTLTIDPTTASVAVDIKNFPLNPKVIGWNSAGAVPLAAGTWVPLENGLQVNFSDGASTYRPGDYWLIPARSGVGILWPLDATNAPLAEPPRGTAHHYARLAIIDLVAISFVNFAFVTEWVFQEDLRQAFSPLIELANPPVSPDALKVQQVFLSATGGTLANDSSLSVATLLGGVQIVCDRALDPLSIKPVTCYVTLSLPFPFDATQAPLWGKGLAGTVPLVLDGQATVSGAAIEWTPTPSAALFLQNQLFQGLVQLGLFSVGGATAGTVGSLLARLTVKGNFVWLSGNPGVHLDGAAVGAPALSNASIDIKLPSGHGVRGSDFEMWFWLTAPAITTFASLTFNPPSIQAVPTSPATGTLALSGPAPAGGFAVTLSATVSDGTPLAQVLTMPSAITIPPGALSATFSVQPYYWGVSHYVQPTPHRIVTITATSGANSITGTLTISPLNITG